MLVTVPVLVTTTMVKLVAVVVLQFGQRWGVWKAGRRGTYVRGGVVVAVCVATGMDRYELQYELATAVLARRHLRTLS